MNQQEGSAQRTKRPKRTPLGTRNVLIAGERKGYVRRWINDVDDRLQRAKDAGYNPVVEAVETSDPRAGSASQVGSTVSKSVGGGVRAVLMEIPEKFYKEDQAEKQRQVDASEAGLSRQHRLKGNQYGGVYGKVKLTSRGNEREMEATEGEAED